MQAELGTRGKVFVVVSGRCGGGLGKGVQGD